MSDILLELGSSIAKGDWMDVLCIIGKKTIDDRTWEQIFVDAGTSVASYEKDRTEESELRAIVFGRDNMRALAKEMRAVNVFDWVSQFKKRMGEWIGQSALSDDNKKRCQKHFCEIVLNQIQSRCGTIYERSLLAQTAEGTSQNIALSMQMLEQMDVLGEAFRKLQEELKQPRQEAKSDGSYGASSHEYHIPHWNLQRYHSSWKFESEEQQRKEIAELTELWRKERESYSGWYILPVNVCIDLNHKTRDRILPLNKEWEDTNAMLLYAYELVWRYEKCMHLYLEYECIRLQKIWDAYLATVAANEDMPMHADKWFYIGQVLLRCYRENAEDGKWKELYKAMQKYADCGANGKEDLLLEQAKYAYHCMDIAALRRAVSKCCFQGDLFEQRLQVLGLRVECGEQQIVLGELTRLNEDIKKKLIKDTQDEEYRVYCMTLQACLLQLLSICCQADAYQNGDYEMEQTSIDQILEEMEQKRELFDWDTWKKSTEHELLGDLTKECIKTTPYELNRETVQIISFGYSGEESYTFYRVMERLALPLQCGRVTLVANMEIPWIRNLLALNEDLGLFLLIRGNKSDAVKALIDRDYVTSIDQKTADRLLKRFIQLLTCNLAELHAWNWDSGELAVHIGENLPEILWRLSDRASEEVQKQNLRLLKKLMEDEELSDHFPFTVFMIQILKRTSEKVKAQMFSEMMATRICEHKSMYGHSEAVDLFECYFNKRNIGPLEKVCTIDQTTIVWLLEDHWGSDYEWRTKVTRLGVLQAYGLLDQNQYRDYARLVWSNVQEGSHCPKMGNRWRYTMEQLPYIDEKIPQTSVKAYFLQNDLEAQMGDTDGCCMHMGHVPYLDELIALCENLEKDYWTKEETVQLLENIMDYWKVLRISLRKKPDGYSYKEYQRRADQMVSAVVALIRNTTYSLDQSVELRLKNMLSEMQDCHIMASELTVCMGADIAWVQSVKEQMLSADRRTAVDALRGVFAYIQFHSNTCEAAELFEELLRLIIYGKTTALLSAVWIVHNLVYARNTVFTQELIRKVDQCLIYLAQYADLEHGISIPIKEKLSVRVASAALAFQMSIWDAYEYGEGVELWRQICTQEEESAEVKKEWIY